METQTVIVPPAALPRAVKIQLHRPVAGQTFKSVIWHWRIETSPLGPYLVGADGRPLEFASREEAEAHAAD